MSSKLDFIVIGAAKAGTTPLYEWIKNHPEIYIPKAKEVPFFSNASYSKGIDWYHKEHFRSAEANQLTGTVTPQYMNGEDNITPNEISDRIHKTAPNVKLIAILRDPVERAYSHYQMAYRRGHENKSFEEAIISLLKPVNLEESRKNVTETNMYISAGEYGRILKPYYKKFNNSQIKIFFNNDLRKEPKKVVKELYEFLGVDEDFVDPSTGKEIHKGGLEPRLKLLTPSFLNKMPLLASLWYDYTPDPVRRRINFGINRWNVKPDKTSVDTSTAAYKKLAKHYQNDAKQIEKITGITPPWTY